MSVDMSSIHMAIVLSQSGTFAMFLTASGPSISLTMVLRAGSSNVSATVWDFFDLARSSATR